MQNETEIFLARYLCIDSKRSQRNRKKCGNLLTAFLKVLFREITENGTFAIPLFGKFTLRTRGGKQKVLYNIHSGQHEEIFVPKYQTITFKISPKLKNTVTSKEYKKYFNHKKIPKRKAPQETDFFNLIAKKTREWKVGKEAVASGYDDNIDEKILTKLNETR